MSLAEYLKLISDITCFSLIFIKAIKNGSLNICRERCFFQFKYLYTLFEHVSNTYNIHVIHLYDCLDDESWQFFVES